MRIVSLAFLAAAVLAVASKPVASAEPLAAAPEPRAASALARQIGEVTHLRPELQLWQKLLSAEASQLDCGVEDEQARARMQEAWASAVAKVFDVERVAAYVEAALAVTVPAEDMERWLAFYRTGLGRRLVAAEDPAQQVSPRGSPPKAAAAPAGSNERKRSLEKLTEASGAVYAFVGSMMATALGTSFGTYAALPEGRPRPELAEILRTVETQRPYFQKMAALMLPSAMAEIYRRFTTAELDAYTAELSTPIGRKVTKAYRQAFTSALKREAMAIGAEFARRATADRI